jgi:large subunit ribosomal protein L17
MRHRIFDGKKLNKDASHRKAMFRNMVTSLIKYERIKTTHPKAKTCQRWAEKMVALAKKQNMQAFNQIYSFVKTREEAKKLFHDIAKR